MIPVNMKKIILCLMLLPALFTSCYKDEGNYDYKELNEITVDTVGVKTSFVIDQYRFACHRAENKLFIVGSSRDGFGVSVDNVFRCVGKRRYRDDRVVDRT